MTTISTITIAQPTNAPTLGSLETAYVSAMNNHDTSSLVACFTADAVVEDEGKIHLGHDAIQAWSSAAFHAYRPHLEVTHVGVSVHHTIITGMVSGNFDGSPVELHHYLHIQGGRIRHLKITT